ncbi:MULTISPECIES: hypothetical protein [unclassified Blastococcus]
MWVPLLLTAGVVLLALPALVMGVRGLFRHHGYSAAHPGDRGPVVVIVVVRAVLLLLLLAASALVLVSTVGAILADVELHGMVYVLFVLDLLLAALVLLTFGRRDRRRARPRATPAAR